MIPYTYKGVAPVGGGTRYKVLAPTYGTHVSHTHMLRICVGTRKHTRWLHHTGTRAPYTYAAHMCGHKECDMGWDAHLVRAQAASAHICYRICVVVGTRWGGPKGVRPHVLRTCAVVKR